MECIKDCCKTFMAKKGKEQETQGKLTSCTAAYRTALTDCFLSDWAVSFAFKWSPWRCLRTRQQHQQWSQTRRGGGSQTITSCPSCPPMAERCRLSCRHSRPRTSNPEGPATPTYHLDHRVRTYRAVTSAGCSHCVCVRRCSVIFRSYLIKLYLTFICKWTATLQKPSWYKCFLKGWKGKQHLCVFNNNECSKWNWYGYSSRNNAELSVLPPLTGNHGS